jgi:hypothetical protein
MNGLSFCAAGGCDAPLRSLGDGDIAGDLSAGAAPRDFNDEAPAIPPMTPIGVNLLLRDAHLQTLERSTSACYDAAITLGMLALGKR